MLCFDFRELDLEHLPERSLPKDCCFEEFGLNLYFFIRISSFGFALATPVCLSNSFFAMAACLFSLLIGVCLSVLSNAVCLSVSFASFFPLELCKLQLMVNDFGSIRSSRLPRVVPTEPELPSRWILGGILLIDFERPSARASNWSTKNSNLVLSSSCLVKTYCLKVLLFSVFKNVLNLFFSSTVSKCLKNPKNLVCSGTSLC